MPRIFSAKVQDGVIVANDVELPEGAVVTVVLADSSEEEYVPTTEELAELDLSLADADRGEGITAAELLTQLSQLPA